MSPQAASAADALEVERWMAQREARVNRQLSATLFWTAIAYAICLLCSLTRVFLTGRCLGVAAFLPGILMMLGAVAVFRRFDRGDQPRPWLKYLLCSALALSVYTLSLIQLVWCTPLVVGGIAFVYSYMNLRMVIVFNLVTFVFLFIAAAMNAAWGMPNPDMLPYPTDVLGIKDGYVTLWAMAHRDAWSQWDYFLRVLRFHSLPVSFLLMIVAGCGVSMVRDGERRLRETLTNARRLREVEACLLLMAGGNVSEEILGAVVQLDDEQAMPPLSAAFVEKIPVSDIPRLVRQFRQRCATDAAYAQLAAQDPERALSQLLQ